MKTTKKVMSLLLLAVLAAGCEPESEGPAYANALMGWRWERIEHSIIDGGVLNSYTENLYFETDSTATRVYEYAEPGDHYFGTEEYTYTFDGREGILLSEKHRYWVEMTYDYDKSAQELVLWRNSAPGVGDVFTRKPL